tara:strand:- start:195 stop:422 length:228 start_codon:yes stop_codon:yes gene_type:complete
MHLLQILLKEIMVDLTDLVELGLVVEVVELPLQVVPQLEVVNLLILVVMVEQEHQIILLTQLLHMQVVAVDLILE